MNPARAGWHTLAIFAILFLLGFGFVVYAVPGVANLAPMSSGNSSAPAASPAQSENVYYRLVQVATTAEGAPGANASGYAGISISGQFLSLEWSVTNAVPGEQLQLVMDAVAASTTGASKSFTFATVEVNAHGEAGSTASATLEPGNYSIGLAVVDPSRSSHSTIFASDPRTAQVVISSSQTTSTQSTLTTTAHQNGLSYSLVPLPVYLGQTAPTNYSFREGGALIIASGNQLSVTTSFLGEPDTRFVNVIQTENHNLTVGAVTTTSTGGGVFKGNITLSPGTYDVGLLLYVYGNTASPVAVSIPRAIRVTLPVTTETSSTTTTAASSSSSSTRAAAVLTNHTTSSSTLSVPSSEAVGHLQFAPVTTTVAPSGYLHGKGSGEFAVTGGSIYFSLLFSGQSPRTSYSLMLSVNGTSRTIGNYTTDEDGGATAKAGAVLGTGTFALSLSVVDLTNFDSPTVVLASVPSSFTVTALAPSTSQSTNTSTSTSTTSFTPSETPGGPEWVFKLAPAVIGTAPPGYHFATSGTAIVSLDARHSLLNVVLGFQHGNPSTT